MADTKAQREYQKEERRHFVKRWLDSLERDARKKAAPVAIDKTANGPTKDERREYFDTETRGLGIRISRTGRMTFFLRARFPGKPYPERRTLGEYPHMTADAARRKAQDWRNSIRAGVDPKHAEERAKAAEERKRKHGFRAVAEEYLRLRVIGPDENNPIQRKGREVKNNLEKHFVRPWGSKPISDITTDDVQAVLDEVVARGKYSMAHNLLENIRPLFAWAISRNKLDRSPCDRMRPKDVIGKPKAVGKRVLNDAEIRAFWHATEQINAGMKKPGQRSIDEICAGYPYGPLFQLLLLTGQRKSEVAEASWREFDLDDKKIWTIPAERMKMAEAHVVPLSDDALAILRGLPTFKSGDYLFSTTYGKTPVNGFSKAKDDLDKLILAELQKDNPKAELPGFVIHDLRRTMRTGIADLEIDDTVAELVIAHTLKGVRKHYDRGRRLDQKRRALDLWAAHVRSIIEPTPPVNVINFSRA